MLEKAAEVCYNTTKHKKGGDEFSMNTYLINLHTHTTVSDGRIPPEDAVERYRSAGYDAIAITDHWKPAMTREVNGFPVFAGCEYNFGGGDCKGGVYHIVALCFDKDPGVTREDTPAECVRKIHAAGGVAVLAHPAWSLNRPEAVLRIDEEEPFDATEIYNTVSGTGHSTRPYSGFFVDQMACLGRPYPLIAADDAHYYDLYPDATVSAIVVDLPTLTSEALRSAIRSGAFYAVKGGRHAPTLCITREGDDILIECSPVSSIEIFSDLAWASGRHVTGEGLTSYRYTLRVEETFVRVEITDEQGNAAYSGFVLH